MGADCNFKDRSGRSASDAAWVHILLNRNNDAGVAKLHDLIGSEDSYDLHLSSLHQITGGLSTGDLELQIDLGPLRIENRDWLGATPLMWASRLSNSTHANILLLRGAKVEARDSSGRTALHYAVEGGSLGCIKALLEAGADAQTADNDGIFPIHSVVYFINNCEVGDIISCLCAHGADLETRDNTGFTPLYRAVDLGSHVSVEALIRCGANMNILGIGNYPPVGRAIINGFDNTVELLCQADTMVSWIDCYGQEINVVSGAVLYGTVRVMGVISRSGIAPVEYNATHLRYWFDKRQDRNLDGYSLAQKRAALERLLEKVVPLNSDVKVSSLVDMEDERPG